MVSAAKVGQMYEEPFINLARSFLNHVIRMDYETGHSMLLKDQPEAAEARSKPAKTGKVVPINSQAEIPF